MRINKIIFCTKNKNHGFTIVELMIATTVFSVVLLIVSSGIIQIGRQYYKGITTTRTQETARSIMEDVARSVQFSSGSIVDEPASDRWCIGQERFTVNLNTKVTGGARGVWFDRISSGAACNEADDTDGRELLGQNMRVLDFVISNTDPKNIKIKIAYGDNDLLNLYDDSGTVRTAVLLPEGQCKSGIAGSSFCAVSGLETTVKRRIL